MFQKIEYRMSRNELGDPDRNTRRNFLRFIDQCLTEAKEAGHGQWMLERILTLEPYFRL